MTELDVIDLALLRALQNDARTSNRDLAELVGVSPSTSLERVRSLRARGVLRGYHAEVDLAALGRPVQALIAIRMRPPSRRNLEAFRDWARRLPQTLAVFALSGDDDYLLHVAVGGIEGLYSFVVDQLADRPEVGDVRTSVVYEHIHRHELEVL